jgi:hypothetical protein
VVGYEGLVGWVETETGRWRGEFYIPTHRDETAMDGHPIFLGLSRENQNGKTEADPY